MDNVITTNYMDENYYVINDADSKLFYLTTVLSDKKDSREYANFILEYFSMIRNLKNLDTKLFISKNSSFGNILEKFIFLEIIDDEKNMIRKETLINSLINAIQNDENTEYINNIISMIKNNKVGRIERLSKNYDPDILNKISKHGKKQNYLSSICSSLTGFESEGLLLKENEFYKFNLITKEILPLEKQDNKKRVKK